MQALGKGNVAKGKELTLANCVACHSLKAESMPAPMDVITSAASSWSKST